MRVNLRKRMRRLEQEIEAKMQDEVTAIYARYGNDEEQMVKHWSQYEKKIMLRWLQPRIIDLYTVMWPLFGPPLIEGLFSVYIYPTILKKDPSQEDEAVVNTLDNHYIRLVSPEIHEDFSNELQICPSFDENPESFGNWRISQKLVDKFAGVRAKLEALKKTIREQIRREEEEDHV